MGLLDSKTPEEIERLNKDSVKPFTVVLEKYKSVVAVQLIKVNDKDDSVLDVEFDHSIEGVSQEEVGEELGKVLINMIEEGLKIYTNSKTEVVKNDE